MKRILLVAFVGIQSILNAQSTPYSSSEIYDDLLRLKNDATVMYIAAHPDDENTRIISWLTHNQHVDAVYLSLTRGEGGQNLIGTESGEALGLLRTQELLEARKIDKGRQWFSRAIDFGYSKNTEDTFQHWDKDKLLGDVVWAIRVNQPEIIITRFHPDSNGETHGHHTASAQLAMEAFDLAADPTAYPEQLNYVKSWQVKRLFFNTSWWFYGSEEAFEKADKNDMIAIDVGKYFPHLGVSNNEIAAMSRSKHACQGFGSALQRGTQTEWLQLLKGDMPKNNDLFDGINLNWKDEKINRLIDEIIDNYDFKAPYKSSAKLFDILRILNVSKNQDTKLSRLKDLILKINGIYVDWTTTEKFGAVEHEVETELEITNRSNQNISFFYENSAPLTLENNEKFSGLKEKILLDYSHLNSPYWLDENPSKNFYQISNERKIGEPINANKITKTIHLEIANNHFSIEVPLQNKYVNPSLGEQYKPFYAMPEFVINFSQPNYIFANEHKFIEVEVNSFIKNTEVIVRLKGDETWKISPYFNYKFQERGEKQKFYFQVIPPDNASSTELIAEVNWNGKTFNKSLQVIDYEHINSQIWLRDAKANVENISLKIPNVKVGYIQGSGDDVDKSLREIGLDIVDLDVKQFNPEILKDLDVIILGIRAFNTIPELEIYKNVLWNFVENGGVVIAQYNTSRGLSEDEISPIPLKLGRDRISDETADLKILKPNHSIFNYPNQITSRDFANWVQERGLYFAESWDKKFEPMLAGNDVGETEKQGILLIADYGKGKYIYTGLSFFRELPAGVSGAYRLMMNMIALGERD